jgi:hypothetical protein
VASPEQWQRPPRILPCNRAAAHGTSCRPSTGIVKALAAAAGKEAKIVHYDPKAVKLGKGEGFPFRWAPKALCFCFHLCLFPLLAELVWLFCTVCLPAG